MSIRWMVPVFALWAAQATAAPARLTIELIEPQSKKPIPGWFRILDGSEQPVVLESEFSRGVGLRPNHPAQRWYAISSKKVLELPKGEVFVEAFSGINSERIRRKLDLRFFDRLSVQLPVRELIPLARQGWHAGNTHLHLRSLTRARAEQYLKTVPVSDRLDLLFVSYLSRPSEEESYISNRLGRDTLQSLGRPGLILDNGEEHRHNFGAYGEGYGHVMFLSLPRLIEPVSIGPGITGKGSDFPPLATGIEEARGLKAIVVWCHNQLGFEDTPNWLAGRVDAQNIFDGGSQGSFGDPYYHYLNVGLAVPLSTGTDWFIDDFSRVYVQIPGPLNREDWLLGLRKGRSFVSNGPLLELTIDEQGLGSRLEFQEPKAVSVVARGVGRHDFGALELLRNGQVIRRVPSRLEDKVFRAQIEMEPVVGEACWFALRVSRGALDTEGALVVPSAAPRRGSGGGTNELGKALFAHTSPIYVDYQGRRVFETDSARELLAKLDVAVKRIDEKGVFLEHHQRETVMEVYQEGIRQLEATLASAEQEEDDRQGDKAAQGGVEHGLGE